MKLGLEERFRFSRFLLDARRSKKWSRNQLLNAAERAAHKLSQYDSTVPVEIRAELIELNLSLRHLEHLENFPVNPLRDNPARARLLAVATALEVDISELNRLAGGI